MKKKKKWLKILALIVVLAVVGAFAAPKFLFADEKGAKQITAHTISRADVRVTITGSGKLEMADTQEIKIPSGVEIEGVYVEAGDRVQEGEVLAAFAADSLEARAAALSSELSALDLQLAARKTVSEIKSPAKGRVKYLPAAEEEDVISAINEHGCLAILSTDEMMQVDVVTDKKLSLNAEVEVKWNGGTADGVVASKTADGYRITLPDEDAPYLAQADIYYNAAQIGSGILEIHAPLEIFGNGGTISEIHADEGDTVSLGGKLFTLENEPAVDSYRQTMYTRSEKAQQLRDVLKFLENPQICAQQNGIVENIDIAEGKMTAAAAGDAVAFAIGVGGATKMIVDVDELDIGKLKVGQNADITLDAFAGEGFGAQVTRISQIGQSAGSITTYAAELTLRGDERHLQGMNGSAVILSDMAEEAVVVPLSAVSEDENGMYVQKIAADGTISIAYIETGLSDGTYAEVTRGLSEGDQIVARESATAFEKMQQMMLENRSAMMEGMQ